MGLPPTPLTPRPLSRPLVVKVLTVSITRTKLLSPRPLLTRPMLPTLGLALLPTLPEKLLSPGPLTGRPLPSRPPLPELLAGSVARCAVAANTVVALVESTTRTARQCGTYTVRSCATSPAPRKACTRSADTETAQVMSEKPPANLPSKARVPSSYSPFPAQLLGTLEMPLDCVHLSNSLS